jgi:bifunctional UDP-N-acetylglucosamine pyrophosphorylase/glucosamine-1-phosphate N-acetyltransferase
MAAEEGRRVAGLPLEDPSEGLGINTRADLAAAARALRARINRHWMLEGVTLVDPQSTYIDVDVVVGRDSVIHPNTHLRGRTAVGEESEIGPHSILEDATVGSRCRVVASVLEQAVMEDESDIGPFSHLRKGARVCRGAHVGNFGEIKKSTLGPGSKMGHFSYLGDAEVGAGVNIGAGTITCNYDGERKHLTRIEDGVFIGSDTMLVAPLHIGEGARTGAGSVVTRDLRPGTLAYGVPAREVRKPEEEPSKES